MARKVLITDTVHPWLIAQLESRDLLVMYHPDISPNECLRIVNNFEGVIINSKIKVDGNFIDQATKLQFIGRLGSGMENVDVGYVEKNGIFICNTPEGNAQAVAEHCLGLLLALLNNVVQAHQAILDDNWQREKYRGVELNGKTVSLIGYGHTAKAFARLLSVFNCKVLAYDPYVSVSNNYVRQVSLNELFLETDILSLHPSLNNTSFQMIDEQFIKSMTKNFYLINTSRGKVVEEMALNKYLKNGKILAAGLDVMQNEPFGSGNLNSREIYAELLQMPQVVFTPHIAGWTNESKLKIAEYIIQKLKKAKQI